MNVLFVGSGSGGSWQIRGVQIGKALGARVTSMPCVADWEWADVAILVKHAAELWGGQYRGLSKAIVIWDVLDWWKQPHENHRQIADLVRDVQALRGRLKIDHLIGATQAMADDIGGVHIPHHSRPGLRPLKVRDRLSVVAYEGTPKYLGSWRREIERVCFERNIRFVVNPPDLAEADLVIAFRGEKWDGPICRRWKSGVKIANAVAVQRPLITQATSAMSEYDACTVIESPSELAAAIDQWQRRDLREIRADMYSDLKRDYTVETIAQQYRHLFDQVMRRAA